MTDQQNNIEQPTQPASEAAEEQAKATRQPTLKEVIKSQATDEDAPLSGGALTFSKIIGGDILNTSTIRRQIWLVLLIVLFIIIYISNRYSCQRSLIEIDNLQKELQDARYKCQATSNRLTEMSRESRVLEQLQDCKDSTLHMPNQPPYLIQIPEQ